MKRLFLLLFPLLAPLTLPAQDPGKSPWHVQAARIDSNNYYGVTVANGMIGIVSSPEPLKVKDVVLNGAYDTYGRGRVSNILKVFDFANMDLEVDGRRLVRADITGYTQTLDLQRAALTTTFSHAGKVDVTYPVRALRHLPHTAMIDVEIKARRDVEVTLHSVLSSPDVLREVKNFYHLIDRPHSLIPLLTSVAQSPTGKQIVVRG